MFELALLTYWYPTDIPFGWGEWRILEDVGIALTTHGGLRGMLARSHQSITLRQIFSTPIYCEGTPNMYINSRGRRAQYQYLRYPEFLSRSPVSRLSLARYHRLDSVLCLFTGGWYRLRFTTLGTFKTMGGILSIRQSSVFNSRLQGRLVWKIRALQYMATDTRRTLGERVSWRSARPHPPRLCLIKILQFLGEDKCYWNIILAFYCK